MAEMTEECPRCDGSGTSPHPVTAVVGTCYRCAGTGTIQVSGTLSGDGVPLAVALDGIEVTLADLADKLNDVLDKCNDIKEVVDEL